MKIISVIFVLFISFSAFAQQKSKTAVKSPEPQAPVSLTFTSSWGPVVSGTALAAQIAAIAPVSILVKDNNGKLYTVGSFRVLYKFKSN